MKKPPCLSILLLFIIVFMNMSCNGNANTSQTEVPNSSPQPPQAQAQVLTGKGALLIGKWKYESGGSTGTHEYLKNGDFIMNGIFTSNDADIKFKCAFNSKGKYILNNNNVSIQVQNVDISCEPASYTKTFEEASKAQTILTEIIQLDEKTMLLKGNDGQTTYTRVE